MLNIYYGRENIDKDRFIFERVEGKTTILVPDQYTLEAEKDAFRFMKTESFLDLEIIGFSRLCDRIIDECGRDRRTMVDKYGRHMLLTRILARKKDELKVYKNLEGTLSFVELMNNFIAQIRQNNISSEMLLAMKEQVDQDSLLAMKLEDICLVYSEYEKVMEGKYIDSESYLDTVNERVEESSYVADRSFWIAGFDTFTGKNYDLLRGLMRCAGDVNVVLTMDFEGRDSELFSITSMAAEKLKAMALEEGIAYARIPVEEPLREVSPAMAALERELYSIPYRKQDDCEGITYVRAGNIYSQVETAASYILELVREKGLAFSDIAVACNNLEQVQPVLGRVFGRYGIPVFVDAKRKVIASSIVTFILSVLRIVTEGFESEDILRMLKTGLTDYRTEEIEILENYITEYRIDKNKWKAPFTRGERYDLEELEALRKKIIGDLLEFEKSFKSDRHMGARIQALYTYLTEKCHLMERIQEMTDRLSGDGYVEEAAHTAQVWNIFAGLLGQIHELIGTEVCNNDELGRMLEAGFMDAETGIIPQVMDGVSIGTCQRSRFGRIRALVVLNADDGILPSVAAGEELLSGDELNLLAESEITLLKLDSIRQAEENLGIYRTFSRPSEYLWIGSNASDEDGKAVKPSSVVAALRRIFPGLKEEQDIFNCGDELMLIAGKEATAEHAVEALRGLKEGRELTPLWKQAVSLLKEQEEDTFKKMEAGLSFTPGIEKVNREKAVSLYSRGGEDLVLSPSALERYGRCPFSYFITYGLNPKERRTFEMAGREIGDVYHEILMEMSKALTLEGVAVTDGKSPWMTIEKDDFDAMMDQLTDKVQKGYRDGLLSSGKEEAYRAGRLKEIVRYIGWMLVGHVRKGRIESASFEASFGRGKEIPPITMEADGKKVFLEGKIDRIDVLAGDKVKIIDYKTGTDTFSREEAEGGWKLQLMLYLAAGLEKDGRHHEPAGVFYFRINEPGLDISSKKAADVEESIRKNYRLDGVLVNDPAVIEAIAGDFGKTSEIVGIKHDKDGQVQGSSAGTLLEPDELSEFNEKVMSKVRELCRNLVRGEISPAPRAHKEKNACTFCSYRSICRFDQAFSECRYVKI